MVSLGGNPSGRVGGGGGGGISFDDRSLNGGEDEPRETTRLIDALEPSYRRISTTPYIVLHILLMIAFISLIVLFPLEICPEKRDNDASTRCGNHSGYNIALYIHAGAYVVHLVFDRLYHHYQDLSRRDGYLEFYRKTRNLRRTPLFIISTGNAILVALILLMEQYRQQIQEWDHHEIFPWHFLALLSAIETFIIVFALMWYLVRTIRFNKRRARPDATEDDLLSTFISPQIPTNELGFQDETYRENVLEKQADLIRYLHERDEYLTRLVLQYKQQADAFSRRNNQHL